MTACLLPPRQNRTDSIDISNITSGNVVISFSLVLISRKCRMHRTPFPFVLSPRRFCSTGLDLAIIEPANYVLSFDWIHINIVVHVNTTGSQKKSQQILATITERKASQVFVSKGLLDLRNVRGEGGRMSFPGEKWNRVSQRASARASVDGGSQSISLTLES